MAQATEIRAAGVPLLQIAGNFAALVSERFTKRKLFNQTFTELSSLTDRELADLGIARSMISQVARQAAYGA